jgi:hypothetical protein
MSTNSLLMESGNTIQEKYQIYSTLFPQINPKIALPGYYRQQRGQQDKLGVCQTI